MLVYTYNNDWDEDHYASTSPNCCYYQTRPMKIEPSLTVFSSSSSSSSFFCALMRRRHVKKKIRIIKESAWKSDYGDVGLCRIRYDTSWYTKILLLFLLLYWCIASSTWNSIKPPDQADADDRTEYSRPMYRPNFIFSQVHWNGTKFKLD